MHDAVSVLKRANLERRQYVGKWKVTGSKSMDNVMRKTCRGADNANESVMHAPRYSGNERICKARQKKLRRFMADLKLKE